MRYFSVALLAHLAGTEVTPAFCLKLTLRNGTVEGFTTHDADLVVGGVTYRSQVGFAISSLKWSNRIEDQNSTVSGLLSSLTGGITESNARLGLYNQADYELFVVNWADLTMGTGPLKAGKVASIQPVGSGYEMELRNLYSPLIKVPIVRAITVSCNAELSDSRCTKARLSFNGTTTASADNSTLTAAAFVGPVTANDLVGGEFVFTSGSLTWFHNQIKSYNGGTKVFVMARPFPPIATLIGLTFTAYEGCDKLASTCKSRFNNLINFRGFHKVPQKDQISKINNIPTGGGYYTPSGGSD